MLIEIKILLLLQSGKASYDTNVYFVAPTDEALWSLKRGLGNAKMS